jgi:hypothetical protein
MTCRTERSVQELDRSGSVTHDHPRCDGMESRWASRSRRHGVSLAPRQVEARASESTASVGSDQPLGSVSCRGESRIRRDQGVVVMSRKSLPCTDSQVSAFRAYDRVRRATMSLGRGAPTPTRPKCCSGRVPIQRCAGVTLCGTREGPARRPRWRRTDNAVSPQRTVRCGTAQLGLSGFLRSIGDAAGPRRQR